MWLLKADARKRVNETMKVSEVTFSCIHGGKNFKLKATGKHNPLIYIQSTLVISNFTGPDKNVRVISSSRQPNCDVIGMTTVRLSVRQTCLEGTCKWQFK